MKIFLNKFLKLISLSIIIIIFIFSSCDKYSIKSIDLPNFTFSEQNSEQSSNNDIIEPSQQNEETHDSKDDEIEDNEQSDIKISSSNPSQSSHGADNTSKIESEEVESTSQKSDSSDEINGNNQTVYVTPSGKKYHKNSRCGGKNSIATTIDEAIKSEKTPCKKCFK